MPDAVFGSQDIPRLDGQVVIVTGGNVGLGFETIRQLSQHSSARIYLAARSKDKAEAAIKSLKEISDDASSISFLSLDLSSFESIRVAAETFRRSESRLDILVNNAGIMMTSEGLTKEGYEIQFGTNVMGPALFTQLLLPELRKAAQTNPETRVVMLSSATERVAPSDVYNLEELKTKMSHRGTATRYGISKLADVHYTTAMSELYADVKFISVHPGMVATNLHHNSSGTFLRPFLHVAINLFATPVEKGALSQIWTAVSPEAKTGEFYGPVGVVHKGSKASKNRKLQESIFQWIQDELQGYL